MPLIDRLFILFLMTILFAISGCDLDTVDPDGDTSETYEDITDVDGDTDNELVDVENETSDGDVDKDLIDTDKLNGDTDQDTDKLDSDTDQDADVDSELEQDSESNGDGDIDFDDDGTEMESPTEHLVPLFGGFTASGGSASSADYNLTFRLAPSRLSIDASNNTFHLKAMIIKN